MNVRRDTDANMEANHDYRNHGQFVAGPLSNRQPARARRRGVLAMRILRVMAIVLILFIGYHVAQALEEAGEPSFTAGIIAILAVLAIGAFARQALK